MRDAFLKQLEELHKMLAEMGLLCEEMIDGTYEALMNMDREQAAAMVPSGAASTPFRAVVPTSKAAI